MSHHNANAVVKHKRCYCEKIKGVILRQVRYTHLSITIKIVQLEHTFSFADAFMKACYDLEIGRIKGIALSKPSSSLVEPLGKTLNGIPPSKCGR